LGPIATALAGGIAERMFFDGPSGDAVDLEIAAGYLDRCGLDVDDIRRLVERTLDHHRERIEHIARNLLMRGTLRDGEIDRLL
jgi:hypothetical protein